MRDERLTLKQQLRWDREMMAMRWRNWCVIERSDWLVCSGPAHVLTHSLPTVGGEGIFTPVNAGCQLATSLSVCYGFVWWQRIERDDTVVALSWHSSVTRRHSQGLQLQSSSSHTVCFSVGSLLHVVQVQQVFHLAAGDCSRYFRFNCVLTCSVCHLLTVLLRRSY